MKQAGHRLNNPSMFHMKKYHERSDSQHEMFITCWWFWKHDITPCHASMLPCLAASKSLVMIEKTKK